MMRDIPDFCSFYSRLLFLLDSNNVLPGILRGRAASTTASCGHGKRSQANLGGHSAGDGQARAFNANAPAHPPDWSLVRLNKA